MVGRHQRWRWGAAAAAVVALPVVTGHASSLVVAPRSLGTSSTAVAQCDTDGFDVVQNLSGSNVVSVTVSQIAAACAGGTLSVTLDNGSTSSSGSATVPGGGGSMTVSLSSAVAADDAGEIDVSVSGP